MILRHLTTSFANSKLHSKYKWGTNDCNILILEFIEFAYPAAPSLLDHVKGKYKDAKSAVKFYKKLNYTWEEYLLDAGFNEINPLYFQPGDIHMHDMPLEFKSLSINVGTHNLIANEERGIVLKDFFVLNEEEDLTAYRFGG